MKRRTKRLPAEAETALAQLASVIGDAVIRKWESELQAAPAQPKRRKP